MERTGLLPTDLSTVANLLLVALILGLSAGIFEEVARYLSFRYWARDAREWRAGLMVGAGHGGIESMILGMLAMVNTAALLGLREGYFTALVTPEQLPLVQAQAQALLDAAWYDALLAPAERLFALIAHLALSVLVMESVFRQRWYWLAGAIVWHALLDALAVLATVRWNVYVAEGVIALFALASVVIILRLRRPAPSVDKASTEQAERREPATIEPVKVDLTAEKLEQSRYQ
jgi:uncharacterized membrane protein YhfC